MKHLLISLCFLLITHCLIAQEVKKINTGKFNGPYTAPLSSSTSSSNLQNPNWDISFQSLPNEGTENLFHVNELKEEKMKQKLASISNTGLPISYNKTAAATSILGKNFRGQDLKSWTPTDNSIAVSKGGLIVSCINQGIAYYDTNGNTHMIGQSWTAFINDTTLKSAKFDPRVIYDSLHDRFIVVMLHGFSSTSSKILTCFSKTNNPLDGWWIYKLSGNPYSDTSWTDYPTIGINDDELFINGNRFGDPPNYPWKGTYIYQIGLAQGYAGSTLQFGSWNNIFTPDTLDGVTLYPASNGLGQRMKEKMYFVQLMPDSGSSVYVFKIDGLVSSPTKTLSSSQYPIPHYEVCADAFQKDPNSGFIDSLSTGSAWTQNAFYVNNILHFTFDADIAGWCGIHYGRVYLDSNKAVVSSWGMTGTDLCYPAVASLGFDSLDRSVAIAYLRSDSSVTLMPQFDMISLDDAMTWSASQTVKKGDTSVNILYPPDNAPQDERWGDYTGICRNYIAGTPQVWMAGAFGANTPPRKNSFGTWIAQFYNGEFHNVGIDPIEKNPASNILYPNPATDMFTLEFENTEDGNVSIDIYDVSGRLVKALFNDYLRKSRNRLSFNKLMLMNGTYLVTITRQGETVMSSKLTIH